MAAWREPRGRIAAPIALVVHIALVGGVVAFVLWKLWTHVLAGLPL